MQDIDAQMMKYRAKMSIFLPFSQMLVDKKVLVWHPTKPVKTCFTYIKFSKLLKYMFNLFLSIKYLQMIFRQFFRLLVKHFCVGQRLRTSLRNTHFSSFLNQNLEKTSKKCEKSSFQLTLRLRTT